MEFKNKHLNQKGKLRSLDLFLLIGGEHCKEEIQLKII
jgi:hypothetical protein